MVIAGKHTVFGRINKGMEIVKRLGQVPTDNNDRWVHTAVPSTCTKRFSTIMSFLAAEYFEYSILFNASAKYDYTSYYKQQHITGTYEK